MTFRTRTHRDPSGQSYTVASCLLENRFLRLIALASYGAPLCAESKRLLMTAPTPDVEQPVQPDRFVENMRQLGEVVRAEEEQAAKDMDAVIDELYRETQMPNRGGAIGRVGEEWAPPT